VEQNRNDQNRDAVRVEAVEQGQSRIKCRWCRRRHVPTFARAGSRGVGNGAQKGQKAPVPHGVDSAELKVFGEAHIYLNAFLSFAQEGCELRLPTGARCVIPYYDWR
jgi:hypothetical protein